MAVIPIGGLAFFGAAGGIGSQAITFNPTQSKQLTYSRQWVQAFTYLAGNKYPFDRYGFSPAPLQEYQGTFVYTLLATPGGTPESNYIEMQGELKVIDDALNIVNSDGTCGLVGFLGVQDANKTDVYQCLARITGLTYELIAGQTNESLDITLTYMILGDFSLV